MPWDDNNVAKLRELWDQGLPTAQIGKLLGFTKNAVVGKAHRIGLERRPSPIRRTAVKPDRKKLLLYTSIQSLSLILFEVIVLVFSD